MTDPTEVQLLRLAWSYQDYLKFPWFKDDQPGPFISSNSMIEPNYTL